LPLLLSKHIKVRLPSFSIAWVMNILFPQITGDELPRSGSATFHLTFFVADHCVGKFFSAQTPVPIGPRQAGQLSEKREPATKSKNKVQRKLVMAK